MKRLYVMTLLAVWAMMRISADDRILLTVGERSITVDEFMYQYRMNNPGEERSPSEYMKAFVNLQLKAMDQQLRGRDTGSVFRAQLQQLEHTAAAPPKVKRSGNRAFDTSYYTDKRMFRFELLTVRVPQHATSNQVREARKLIERAAERVKKGERPEVNTLTSTTGLRVEYTDETQGLPAVGLLDEMIAAYDALSEGQWSAPFESPYGWQLIRRVGDTMADVDSVEPVPATQIPKSELQRKALEDALLASYYDMDNAYLLNRVVSDNELKAYFDRQPKTYKWAMPHYKGSIIICNDKKQAKRLKKMLKSLPVDERTERLEAEAKEHPESELRWVNGLYRIGKNSWVDYVVFGQGDIPQELVGKRIVKMGKKLKKGPETYRDVYERVAADYRTYLEEQALAPLRQKIKVEVHEGILK